MPVLPKGSKRTPKTAKAKKGILKSEEKRHTLNRLSCQSYIRALLKCVHQTDHLSISHDSLLIIESYVSVFYHKLVDNAIEILRKDHGKVLGLREFQIAVFHCFPNTVAHHALDTGVNKVSRYNKSINTQEREKFYDTVNTEEFDDVEEVLNVTPEKWENTEVSDDWKSVEDLEEWKKLKEGWTNEEYLEDWKNEESLKDRENDEGLKSWNKEDLEDSENTESSNDWEIVEDLDDGKNMKDLEGWKKEKHLINWENKKRLINWKNNEDLEDLENEEDLEGWENEEDLKYWKDMEKSLDWKHMLETKDWKKLFKDRYTTNDKIYMKVRKKKFIPQPTFYPWNVQQEYKRPRKKKYPY